MRDRIVRGILWLGGASLLSQAATWLSTLVVARLLTPADYGLIGLAGIYIGLAEQVNELGVGAAIVQRQDLQERDIRGIYTVSILVGVGMALLTVALAPVLAHFFHEERLTEIIRLLSLTFVINSAKSVQRNLMIRELRFPEIAKMDAGASILTSLSALAMAVAGCGVWTLAIQYILRNFILLTWAFWYERRLPGRIEDFQRMKEMLSFGAGISGSNFLFSVNRNADSLIVGKVLGKVTLGAYSFAQVLADKPFEKILAILNQVFYPVLSKMQNDKEKKKQYFFRIVELEAFVLTPIFVTLMLVAPELVDVVLGVKWQAMIVPLQVFAAIGIFKYVENRIGMMFNSDGNSRPQFLYMATLVPVMAASLFAAAASFGLDGVLAVWGGVYPAVFLWYLHYFLQSMGIAWSSFLAIWRMPVISALVMSLATILVSLSSPVHGAAALAMKVAMCVISYLVVNVAMNKKMVTETVSLFKSKAAKPVVIA